MAKIASPMMAAANTAAPTPMPAAPPVERPLPSTSDELDAEDVAAAGFVDDSTTLDVVLVVIVDKRDEVVDVVGAPTSSVILK